MAVELSLANKLIETRVSMEDPKI